MTLELNMCVNVMLTANSQNSYPTLQQNTNTSIITLIHIIYLF
jgi:hypothetical protein